MIEQGTPEWHQQRLGKATASRIADIIAKTKTGYSTSRANYAAELVAERLTGTPAEHYQNAAMQWGKDKEPEAKAAYEFMRNVDIRAAEFVTHPILAMAGASPDGYIVADTPEGFSGLIEIKCPITATHIDTLLSGKVADKYIVQMQWQMACTGARWCDFVSYDPRLPAHLQMFIQRVPADAARIAELTEEVARFLAEVDITVAKLRAIAPRAEAA